MPANNPAWASEKPNLRTSRKATKLLSPKPTIDASVDPASRWRALASAVRRRTTAPSDGTSALASRSWRPRGGSAISAQASSASTMPGIITMKKALRQPYSWPTQAPPAEPMKAPIGGDSNRTDIAVARRSGGK